MADDLERAADAIEAEWYLAGPPKKLPAKPPPDDLEPETPPPLPRRRH